MSGDLDLEQRYRRVLRLLPGYYRDKWEEDMVATFLDGWLTGDPDEDSVTMEYDRPTRQEIVSVTGLAARLRLGGTGAPRRYFAWGQAVRNAVLGVMLAHAVGAARAAGEHAGVAVRVVGVPGRDRPCPGPGDGRVPPGRTAGRPPTLAAGAARVVPARVSAGAGGRAVRPRRVGAGRRRAVLHPGHSGLP